MQSSQNENLFALCAYGVDRSLSEQLITRYGNEYDVPLYELDKTEYNRTLTD